MVYVLAIYFEVGFAGFGFVCCLLIAPGCVGGRAMVFRVVCY